MRELESHDIITLYVNCWDDHSTHKVLAKMCYLLGNPFVQHKPTNELLLTFKSLCTQPVVLVLDEIDKLEDTDVLYTLFESISVKTIIMLTNYRSAYKKIDERVRSRLHTEFLEFKPYTREEIEGIMKKIYSTHSCSSHSTFYRPLSTRVTQCTMLELACTFYVRQD